MVAFQHKNLDDLTIGEALRAAREERNESIEDVERITHVGKKYIAALEANDLKKLPEPVYAKKFVRALAAHFGIDQNAAAENLLKEMAVSVGAPVADRPVNFVEGRGMVVTPARFKSALVAAVFLAIVGYFAYSVHHILKPPALTVYSPRDEQVFSTSRVVLEGQTEPEVDLEINGEAVTIEQDGAFKDILNLPPGVSNLRLTAKKKHSRENQVFLKVVVEGTPAIDSGSDTPEASASATPPTAATSTAPVPPAPKPKPKPVDVPPAATSTLPTIAPPQ